MNYLLDSNVLLRMAEPGHAHHQAAADATDLLGRQGHTLCLVPQDYYEFWVVSTRPVDKNGRGKTPDEVLAEFAFLDTHFTLLPESAAVFAEWRGLLAAHKPLGKPAHDARFVAAMRAHGVTHLLTFNDQDFRRYPGITPVSPLSLLTPPTPAS
ncbi:MAG: PIN domain-containing protein [Gemmataceae bacterium]|nr:PIN domain-containing protein [Gemmataceae bacterium]